MHGSEGTCDEEQECEKSSHCGRFSVRAETKEMTSGPLGPLRLFEMCNEKNKTEPRACSSVRNLSKRARGEKASTETKLDDRISKGKHGRGRKDFKQGKGTRI